MITKSQHLPKDQYSFLMASPSHITKLPNLEQYRQRFASIDGIHKLAYLEAAHCCESERFSSVLYDDLLGDRFVPRYPKLTYLTESAVQLFEQTKVPDLLYHEKEHGDIQDWQEDDSDRYRRTTEIKIYSELRGLNAPKQRYEPSANYQHYGVVR